MSRVGRGRGISGFPPLVFLVFLIILAGPGRVFAQQATGAIRGVVADKEGKPIPGVTLVLNSERLGIRDKGVVTDLAGNYKITHLPPGDYKLKVSFPTFATYNLSVTVEAGRTVRQDITLRPESELREEIIVTAKNEIVDLEDTTTSTVIDSTFIEGLPVVGRDYRDILILAPGVDDSDGDGNVNINGSRDRDVLTTVDGINVNDPFSGSNSINVNLEAIGEVELITAGAGAEFGGKSGGFINITTKSGTNDFEGAFKFFLRTNILDGDGAGTDPPNMHGGLGPAAGFRDVDFDEFRPFLSLGGAIIQDKLWYFVSNQFISIDTPVNAVTQVFVTNNEGFQEFAKLTWQANSVIKPSLSLQFVPFEFTNLGLSSVTAPETAYDLHTNRSVLTLDIPYILSPRVFLESTFSFDNGANEWIPLTSPDLNGNGLQYRRPTNRDDECPLGAACLDANGDFFIDDTENPTGFFAPIFRDLGEDFNSNGIVDEAPEGFGLPGLCIMDGAGRLICEGDEKRPGTFGNGDGFLDPADRDALFFVQQNLLTGPNSQNFIDLKRDRFTAKGAISQEIDDFFGTHTIKIGASYEDETFLRDFTLRTIGILNLNGGGTGVGQGGSITAIVPAQSRVPDMGADAQFLGFFVDEKYKPIPNLTVGIGVRFDRSEINSSGFTQFDPVRERAVFDRVQQQLANVKNGELLTDPILNFQQQTAFVQTLGRGAVNQFTAHLLATEFDSDNTFVKLRKGDRLTSQLGESFNTQRPEDFEITNNNLSPRLSISWDPWANGKTKMFATYGRFYDRIFLQSAVWELNPAIISRDYLFDTDFVDDLTGLFNRGIGQKLNVAAPSTQQLDRRLQDPFSNEYTLGFERELAPELSVGITYVNRKWQDQLQDTDINHLVNPLDVIGLRVRNTDGTSVVDLPDGLPDLTIQNFFFNQILFLGNTNSQNFESVALTVTRRQHRNWQMQGSYVYSVSEGAAEDFNLEAGNDPSVTENEFGFLSFDRTHVVKFSATTFLPNDISLGGSAEWGSGFPFSTVRRQSSRDDIGFATFRRRFPSGRRNDERNDATLNFNLNFKKSFVIGKVSAAAQITAENILNSDDLRVIEINDASFSNQLISFRQFGRRFELGLILNF